MSKTPTHTIFAVVKPEGATDDEKGLWTPVGVAWTHAGGGFGLSFDEKRTSTGPNGETLIDYPAGARLVARVRKAKPEGGQQ
jgi:hypothetical protein